MSILFTEILFLCDGSNTWNDSLGVSESSNWVTSLSNTSVCTSISEEPSSWTNLNVDEDLDKGVLAIDNRGFADVVAIPDDFSLHCSPASPNMMPKGLLFGKPMVAIWALFVQISWHDFVGISIKKTICAVVDTLCKFLDNF